METIVEKKVAKSLTIAETKDIFKNADINLPPLSNPDKVRCELVTIFCHKYLPEVVINIFDDEAKTAWVYNFNTKEYSNAGYGKECCWTNDEPFYPEYLEDETWGAEEDDFEDDENWD